MQPDTIVGSPRKMLVTGAAGRTGQLMLATAPPKWSVAGLDIVKGGDNSIVIGDFGDDALLDTLLPGCEIVVHLAGLNGRQRRSHTPAQFMQTNVVGMTTLLDACLRHGVRRVVFSSTMEVLIGCDAMAAGMAVIDESTKPRPNCRYPASKLLCEQLCEFYYRHHGLEIAIVRYMGFDGKSPPSVRLLGMQVMQQDAVSATWAAALTPHLGYEIFNIGSGTPLTNADLVAAQTNPEAVIDKYWPGASALLREHGVTLEARHFWPLTRSDKAWQYLGWRPVWTFERYLRDLGWNG